MCETKRTLEKLNQVFLVTKTISNAEAWASLDAWQPSIKAEYDQLVKNKQAVRQITKTELQRLAQQRGCRLKCCQKNGAHQESWQRGF